MFLFFFKTHRSLDMIRNVNLSNFVFCSNFVPLMVLETLTFSLDIPYIVQTCVFVIYVRAAKSGTMNGIKTNISLSISNQININIYGSKFLNYMDTRMLKTFLYNSSDSTSKLLMIYERLKFNIHVLISDTKLTNYLRF